MTRERLDRSLRFLCTLSAPDLQMVWIGLAFQALPDRTPPFLSTAELPFVMPLMLLPMLPGLLLLSLLMLYLLLRPAAARHC